MIKKFFVLILLFIFSMPVYGETIKAGVSYTEEEVRAFAFKGVKTKLPRKMIKANQVDPFYDENIKYREKSVEEVDLEDRIIYLFSDGNYSIHYKKNMEYGFWYNSIGNLISILLHLDDGQKLTFKAVTYRKDGSLEDLFYWRPSLDLLYMFDANKKLIRIINTKDLNKKNSLK